MIKIRKKIIICIIIVMMIITQIPAGQSTYAQINTMFEVGLIEESDSKRIEVREIKEEVKRVDLFLNEDVIQTKLSQEGLAFDIYSNGTYVIKGYDEKEVLISEENIEVTSFEVLSIVEDVSTHEVKIISRDLQTDKVMVNETESVDVLQVHPGYYEASYRLPKNGEYTFSILDKDGNHLTSKTLTYQNIPQINEEGDFIIRSEEDIKQIINHPSGTFILENDIELTSSLLKDVNFTGILEGNGYRISGFSESLFNSIENATINNIIINGSLANTSTHSTISNTGFYVEVDDDKKDSAVILKSENTTISHSFALMNVEGHFVSGFILEGTGTIENSYVSGYLKGEEVYGFGKDVNIKNSYITASLVGETRILFSNGELEGCFYDAQINDLEELKALPMYTKDMISKDFINEEFKIIEGQYPQIKNIDEMKEKAQAVSTLSVQSVKTDSNLSTLKGKVEVEEVENVKWKKSTKEISAKSNDTMNRFALKQARAVKSITVGASTNATTTQITYPITMGKYYKVLKANETQPKLPASHKQAIESGWKIMYWDGDYKQAGLEWNTQYNVYSTNLTTVTIDGTVTTIHGINGGKVTLSGTYDDSQTMTATLSGTNTTKGTMYFESATTLDATTWDTVQTTPMDGTSDNATYTVASTLKGKYLRARFVADATTGYQGEVIDKTKTIFKEAITDVTIENKTSKNTTYTLNDELMVNMTRAGKENDVVFKWYHKDGTEPIATGRNYKIKASDIGKQLFVQAEAKADGDFKGSKDSDLTDAVLAIKHTTPTATGQLKEVSKDDITVTLTMDVTEGLYRYGYREGNTTNTLNEYSILARNQTKTTITGLKPNTMYYFYVQRVGENGFVDSEWSSTYLQVTTDREHVKGDVVVSGNAIYNEKLTASLKNNSANQTGQFVWYRLDNDGKRTEIASNTTTYTLETTDIGKKIEVAYKGTESYAGEISTITDTISKAEIAAPTTNLTVSNFEDTTITVTMPNNTTGEKYILGISQSKDGIPIELLESNIVKELGSGVSYTITGLDRDTTYFLYVRYAENDTHQKSDWIVSSSATSQKTKTKDFTGNITFTYETANLMKGQTLTAKLNPTDGASFNFKGEWKWTKIDGTNESTINNFTLTNNKQGTQYVVPADEALDVTYKVTFTANVGYTGTVFATSTKVHDIVKEKYKKPIADDIVMEAIDDTSIKVKMDSGEGKYHFWYKEKDQNAWDSIRGFFNKTFVDPNDGFREVKAATDTGVDVLANTDVVISGLDRNTEYIVRVQRVGDDKGTTSDFTYSTEKTFGATSVFTKKTEIAGHVTIEGTTKFGQTLTAKYHAATYASTGSGSDTDGTWQWYRGNTPITNAMNAKYIPVLEDIGSELTVKYTMPDAHNFTGQVEAKTNTIQKADGVSPTIENIKSEDVKGKITMTITGALGTGGERSVYYRLQKADDREPSPLPTLEHPTVLGWHQVTSPTMENITLDCNNTPLVANTEYRIYFIKIATATEESTPMLSQTHKTGTLQQSGRISFESPTDTTKQAFVVGQTVTATLGIGSNSKGTWKWYMSTTKFNGSNSSPDPTETSSWKEITSGFSQTLDNEKSSLNLSEDMFGYFIRAEFVASDDSGFSGSISSTESQYVRKIYDEKLTITSKTKDGNGNPKAYANTVITGKIDNYAESGNLDRTTVHFKVGDSMYITSPILSNGTFTYTMPNKKEYDGQKITAEVSTPKIIGLYVDTNLKAMTTKTLNSDTSTGTSMFYSAGIPISTPQDLYNFMLRSKGTYKTDYYIITANIDMSNSTKINQDQVTILKDGGVLDGDFHTIYGLKNYIFEDIQSSTSGMPLSEVKNLIVINSNLSSAGSAGVIARGSSYVKYQKLMLIDSSITSGLRAGFLSGTIKDAEVSEIFSSGGGATTSGNDWISNSDKSTAGALMGESNGNISINDVSTISSNVNATRASSNTPSGGLIGYIGTNSTISSNNLLVASNVIASQGRRGPIVGYKENSGVLQQTNSYYDSKKYTNLDNGIGIGKDTSNITGNSLKSNFGTDKWVYNEGYYPRLKWLENNPIAKLYTATRGAFTSVDGATNSTEMFNGIIKGPIQIPAELQTKDFTVSSTNIDVSNTDILKVTESGMIIPVGSVGQKATITIKYTEPDQTIKGTASNTFEFTIGKQVSAMSNVSIVDNTTGSVLSTAPTMNQVLRANVGTSWQWYRRKNGSTTTEEISGATGQTYKVKSGDVGYEISVLVKKDNYASTYSSYTKAAVSITPSAPAVVDITDNFVILNAFGDSAFRYEFGYQRSNQNALVTPIDGIYTATEVVTINNLQRNKEYKFYTRIAEGEGYPASAWSPFTLKSTLKTKIIGTPQFGTAINNGAELSLNMATTNGQTGTWKLVRFNVSGETDITNSLVTSSNNTAKYMLTSSDVGCRIIATFTGSGDFEGIVSAESDVIKNSIPSTPNAPILVEVKDTSIVIKMEDTGDFLIEYATSPTGEKEYLTTSNGIPQNTELSIPKLKRNTDYYFFARKLSPDKRETSAYSAPLRVTTSKTKITGLNVTSGSDRYQVDDLVQFSFDNLLEGVTGTWKLERVNDTSSSTTTISPNDYTVDYVNRLNYHMKPKDAGSKLKATFTGSGDFEGTIAGESNIVINAKQLNWGLGKDNIEITDVKDHSLKVKMKEGTEIYQFGYRIEIPGTVTPIIAVDSTVPAATDVIIDGLKRNTYYQIYVRIAAKTGYDASEWSSEFKGQRTKKSTLTGTAEYVKVVDGKEEPAKVGVAEVGATYKATYTVDENGEEKLTKIGDEWLWYVGDELVSRTEGNSSIFKIEPREGNPEITAKYIADVGYTGDGDDFAGERSVSIGTLTKPAYEPPTTLPKITPLPEDTTTGSKLKIESTIIDNVFYYVQKAENAKVPATTLASNVESNPATTDKWFKATTSMTLNLEANTSYVVFVARLEDGSHLSSGVISHRAVKTVKDDIGKITSVSIAEEDTKLNWKVLQDKELRIHRDHEPVDGVWQYYVTRDIDDEASWQNITAEVKVNSTEGNTNTYTYTKVNVPLKYANGYFFRAVFTGRGDLEGSEIYTSSKALIGTMLKGSAELSTGNTSQVFVPIEAKYVYAKDSGVDIIDEENGIWTWYREETGDDTIVKKGTVGISDTYTPTVEDVNKRIYATYSGAPDGIYSGSVTSNTLDNVTRATQNTPDAITLKQVSGTSVQINLPTNMKADGKTIAQPQLEYHIKDSGSTWTTNSEGDAWIKGLKANTEYEVRVLFVGTSEYLPSSYGATITVKTGNQSFDEDNLEITQPSILESGNKITATFSGSGYDEGYFVVKRSDGTIIKNKVEGTVTNGFLFTSGSRQMQYTSTNDDIGSNIIIEFKANATAPTYGGSIEKSTKEVLKPINPTKAGTPVLTTVQYDETVLRVDVNDANEYVFNDSETAVSETSGDWQKLTKDAGQNYHTFTGLDKTKDYYLHVRTAETQTYRYSREDVSAATKPWASTQYTITYEGMDGATNGNPTNPSQYTELSPTITLNDASKNGYTFTGWTTDTITSPQKGLTIPTHSSGAKKFTANWAIITYDITYSGGGTFATVNPATYTVETNEFTLTNPTRTGYDFTGWTYSGETTPQMSVTIPKGTYENKVYTANWKAKEYKITYDLKQGTNHVDNPEDYTIESTTFSLKEPTRDGYTFTGWTGTGIGPTPQKVVTIAEGSTGAKTYTANWNINKYTATFKSNGGTPDDQTVTKNYQEALGLLPEVTRTGYTFAGWYPNADGTGTKIETTTPMPVDGATYYAHWTINQYIATFDSNGGDQADQTITKNYQEVLGKLPTVEQSGYTFAGWFTNDNGTGTKIETTTLMPLNGATYYAHWVIQEPVKLKKEGFVIEASFHGEVSFYDKAGQEYDKNMVHANELRTEVILDPTFTNWDELYFKVSNSTSSDKPLLGKLNVILTIDEKTFPDEGFRWFVTTKYDVNTSGTLSVDEIQGVNVMEIKQLADGRKLSNIKGIEYFFHLEKLTITNATFNVNLSNCLKENIKLKYLRLEGKTNSLSFDLSELSTLETLYIKEEENKTFILPKYAADLTSIELFTPEIESITLGEYPKLNMLSIGHIDDAKEPEIVTGGTSLDLSSYSDLETLLIFAIPFMEIKLGTHNKLTLIDINNSISSIDLSNVPNLEELSLVANAITVLDLGKVALTSFDGAVQKIKCELSYNDALGWYKDIEFSGDVKFPNHSTVRYDKVNKRLYFDEPVNGSIPFVTHVIDKNGTPRELSGNLEVSYKGIYVRANNAVIKQSEAKLLTKESDVQPYQNMVTTPIRKDNDVKTSITNFETLQTGKLGTYTVKHSLTYEEDGKPITTEKEVKLHVVEDDSTIAVGLQSYLDGVNDVYIKPVGSQTDEDLVKELLDKIGPEYGVFEKDQMSVNNDSTQFNIEKGDLDNIRIVSLTHQEEQTVEITLHHKTSSLTKTIQVHVVNTDPIVLMKIPASIELERSTEYQVEASQTIEIALSETAKNGASLFPGTFVVKSDPYVSLYLDGIESKNSFIAQLFNENKEWVTTENPILMTLNARDTTSKKVSIKAFENKGLPQGTYSGIMKLILSYEEVSP